MAMTQPPPSLRAMSPHPSSVAVPASPPSAGTDPATLHSPARSGTINAEGLDDAEAALAEALTGTEHELATEALRQILDAQADGTDPSHMLKLLADTSAQAKWDALRDRITQAHRTLTQRPDICLSDHTGQAAERVVGYANDVCDHLADQQRRWRQEVLAEHCDRFVRLCHKAITGEDLTTTTPADTSDEPAAAEIAPVGRTPAATDDATLGGLVDAHQTPDVPLEAAPATEDPPAIPLSELVEYDTVPLGERITDLLSHANDPLLFLVKKPELGQLHSAWTAFGQRRGTTDEAARKAVAHDAQLIRSLLASDEFETVRRAVEKMQNHLGIIAPPASDILAQWRSLLDEPQFEALRWLACYHHEGGWLVRDSATSKDSVMQALDEAAGGDWLVRADDLFARVDGLRPGSGLALLAESKTWRDIGDGWLVRWDGTLQDKAARGVASGRQTDDTHRTDRSDRLRNRNIAQKQPRLRHSERRQPPQAGTAAMGRRCLRDDPRRDQPENRARQQDSASLGDP